jgi:hypothetical protein
MGASVATGGSVADWPHAVAASDSASPRTLHERTFGFILLFLLKLPALSGIILSTPA